MSSNEGKTWIEANLVQGLKNEHSYIADDDEHRHIWAWVLWEVVVQINSPMSIIAKAVSLPLVFLILKIQFYRDFCFH